MPVDEKSSITAHSQSLCAPLVLLPGCIAIGGTAARARAKGTAFCSAHGLALVRSQGCRGSGRGTPVRVEVGVEVLCLGRRATAPTATATALAPPFATSPSLAGDRPCRRRRRLDDDGAGAADPDGYAGGGRRGRLRREHGDLQWPAVEWDTIERVDCLLGIDLPHVHDVG
mmetsp:Transcript_12710/g.36631  ORF Transcript_12710/g.36631 Transcript_12710/m.36631 type:complete len:171 (-) Transcript_12710:378-890(-)